MNRLAVCGLVLFAACAASEAAPEDFDSSAGLAEVVVGGDAFVRYDGERMPWEEAVVRLRLRTRALDDGQRQRFVVHLRAEPQEPGSAAAANAQQIMNRLMDQVFVMGVLQVKFL